MCSMACAGLNSTDPTTESHVKKVVCSKKKGCPNRYFSGLFMREMYYYLSIKNIFSYPFCHDVYGLVDELEARFYPVKVSAAVGKF